MTGQSHPTTQRFEFATVFSEDGEILRTREGPRKAFTPDEVQAAKDAAFAEGEASVRAKAEQSATALLAQIADNARTLTQSLSAEAAQLRQEAVDLGLAAARVAGGHALAAYPVEAVTGFFNEIATHLRTTARLQIRVSEGALEEVRSQIEAMAGAQGLEAAIEVRADQDAKPGDCTVAWEGGAILRRQDDAHEALREAAQRWLQANTSAAGDDGENGGEVQLSLFDSF